MIGVLAPPALEVGQLLVEVARDADRRDSDWPGSDCCRRRRDRLRRRCRRWSAPLPASPVATTGWLCRSAPVRATAALRTQKRRSLADASSSLLYAVRRCARGPLSTVRPMPVQTKRSAHSSLSAPVPYAGRASAESARARLDVRCSSVGRARTSCRPTAAQRSPFAGRSNAGKSSAINAICGRRKLAFVSRTPGRTQLINFFDLWGTSDYLVDLPGYGYAKVPAAIHGRWEELLGAYLPRTACVARTGARDGCASSAHAARPADARLVCASPESRCTCCSPRRTSCPDRQQMRQQDRTRRTTGPIVPAVSAQLFSSVTAAGVEEARQLLASAVDLLAPRVEAEEAGPEVKFAPRYRRAQKENPRLKGIKPGVKPQFWIKAPAQGGEAGDETVCRVRRPRTREVPHRCGRHARAFRTGRRLAGRP